MMTIDPRPAFRLKTTWTPASEGGNPAYALTLTNNSPSPVGNFRLCFSGPARIDPAATIEGGTLVERSPTTRSSRRRKASCFSRGILDGDARGLSYPLRHWTDGATGAYLAFADGTTCPGRGQRRRAKSATMRPLKRGAEIYPVPDSAPAPISVVPWPQECARYRASGVPPAWICCPPGGKTQARPPRLSATHR